MSHWSNQRDRNRGDGMGAGGRPYRTATHGRSTPVGDYTLAHGGRQIRLGPVAFWIAVGSVVVMSLWSVTTATYFAFRDDVLTRLIVRHAEMQSAYEDRIADMRAQVDRITSRQLLDQDQFEQKLDKLARRQSMLESRAATLGSIVDPMPTGSVKPTMRSMPGDPPAAAPPKPSPISDTVIFVAPDDREARLDLHTNPASAHRGGGKTKNGNVETALTRLQASLDRVEARQAKAMSALEQSFDVRARRMRGVIADLGLDLGKLTSGSGMGGPFVPVKQLSDASAFERQLQRISLSRAHLDRLARTLVSVPVRKPINGEIDTSSGFGVRIDPFLRAPAMHTGLDFRGTTGEAVRATAAGAVTIAGWNGGYGKLVEIDHGNGLSTRYGHLLSIDVEVGEKVRSGQIVGRLGSTGRSTGPHLHYETRVDGDAVDPQKFLRAGVRLGPNL